MTTAQNQLRVAFYIRVSTEEQIDRFGKDLQLNSVEALIRSKGKLDDGRPAMILASKDHIYMDEGISGKMELRERPAFGRLIEDIELAPEGKRPFDAVVVYKIDRFARKLSILLKVVDFFEKYDIQFLSANESIDTSSPFGKAILGILGVIAELEIETTRMRTVGGKNQAREKGVYMGQSPPYGYIKNENKTLSVFEEEAKIVRDIFNWFVYDGLTAQDIANRLRSLNILSPHASSVFYHKRKGTIHKTNDNTFWRLESVRDLLDDRIYMGEYWFDKTEFDKKAGKVVKLPKEKWKLSAFRYPTIIERSVFNVAQTLLNKSKDKVRLYSQDRGTHVYILSGLLQCRNCAQHGTMINWIGDRKQVPKTTEYMYYYKCGRKNRKKHSHICTVLPIAADPLEKYIVKFVMKLLEDPQMVYKHQKELLSTKSEIERLKRLREGYIQTINSIPKQIENIRDQHTNGIIDTPKMLTEIKAREDRQKKCEDELADIDRKVGQNELTRGYLNTFEEFSKKYKLSLENLKHNRRELGTILHSLIDSIVIDSRPVLEIDSVAGRKAKDAQFMPYGIEIKLKLPEEILTMLARTEFGAASGNL